MRNEQLPHDADPLLAVAEAQHGLISRADARAAGVGQRAWECRVEGPHWHALSDRVLRRTGAPRTEPQAALAAVLDMGPHAYLSHRSAAALWGVPGFRLLPPHVMVTRGRRTESSLATVHRPRHLTDPFAAELDGIPVVRPALLLLQLAPIVHPGRLGVILDGLWSRRLLSGESVRHELEPVLGRGRAGTKVIRELLQERGEGYVPPASGLEARFSRIVLEHDLPPMRRQVDLGRERWCGRVDFVAVDLPLVVEVDSDRYHLALTDRAADAAREEQLVAAGFEVVRVDEHEVWHEPSAAAERIRRAAWRARASQARRHAA